jgi:hypothetical protein
LISFWGYRGREWDFLLGGTSSRAEDKSEKILVTNAKRGSIVKKVHLAQQKEQKRLAEEQYHGTEGALQLAPAPLPLCQALQRILQRV